MSLNTSEQFEGKEVRTSDVNNCLKLVRKLVEYCIFFDPRYSKNLVNRVEFVPE